ncbi:phosphotransferase [Prosthecobacter sp.]|uniref:phosphotransferase enzyme family protein n=1 Tax=Prosthecobacter sp. TaxID=1965333 RepID=UPI0024885946|nr:phosphotransferase [Prosthecobacter sp.]MDI1315437.1 phosphotransferase [Prosthecobacter sp.]
MIIQDDHLALLARPYGLAPGELEFLRSSQNHVYLCRRDGEKFILRVSKERHRDLADVEAELAWVEFLSARRVDVCRPIPTLGGEACVALCLDGENHVATCFEHAPGAKITPQDIAPPVYEKLGGVLAQMHTHTLDLPGNHAAQARAPWHESRLLREDVAGLQGRLSPQFSASLADLIHELQALSVNPKTYGLIHADACLGNCFLEDDRLWIFDFDNSEKGHFIQDFATILYDSIYCRVLNKFADAGLNDRMAPLWAGLWKGYSKSGPLTEIDPLQLKRFFLLREAVIYIQYHRTLDVLTLDDSFKAGLEVMRTNVENQEHQVDFRQLSKHPTSD